LRDLGYVKGTHFVVLLRAAEGKNERLDRLAEELVKLKVDLILTAGTLATQAARRATATIPIVFVEVTDPVGSGLAESLSHPGHNMTGLSPMGHEMHAKRVELLKLMVPGLSRLAVLFNRNSPLYPASVDRTQAAAERMGMRMLAVSASVPEDFEPAFKEMTAFNADAVYVVPDPVFSDQNERIADLALRSRLPSMAWATELVKVGVLMSYGPDSDEWWMQPAATYVDRIFRGKKPGDLPIQLPTKIDLIINRRTAKAVAVDYSAHPPLASDTGDRLVRLGQETSHSVKNVFANHGVASTARPR
jgi:putative ABC transport system substrate-binding protein